MTHEQIPRCARNDSKGRISLLVLAIAIAGCDIGTVNVPKTNASIVVHAILNTNSGTQLVLLERSLSGAVTIKDKPFDSTDPIVSDGGLAISGATVEIIDSLGRTFRGVEDLITLQNGKGAGVYRVPLIGSALILGGRYQLRIQTLQGETATGFTRIPRVVIRATGGLTRTMNRDRDTLIVTWAPVPTARSYAVRVESPFGPFFLFTDSSRIALFGELRNLFASDLQRVFIPGFRQDILVAAVDSNFYDYYRTNDDPFTGSGIISRIKGGIGLFGAMTTLNSGTITVTANQTEPIEGRFRSIPIDGAVVNPFLQQVVLYVESPPAHEDLPAALSGRYTTNPPNSRSDGILGEKLGSNVTLTLLANQLSGDTVDVFTGTLKGDTISGTYRNGTPAVFVRSP